MLKRCLLFEKLKNKQNLKTNSKIKFMITLVYYIMWFYNLLFYMLLNTLLKLPALGWVRSGTDSVIQVIN